MLPLDHPFARFNRYFYLQSGTHKMPIYIFKFDEDGVLIEMHFDDKENGPRGRLYSLAFDGEYDFKITQKCSQLIRRTEGELYDTIGHVLDMEVLRHGDQPREDS